MGADIMRLKGYRAADARLLTGPWLPGELLGLPVPGRPALAEPVTVRPSADGSEELCVVPGAGFVRYTQIDWTHRRAQLEIGLAPGPELVADEIGVLVKNAVAHGFGALNLRRLHGWVTPAAQPPTEVVAEAGFRLEARLPQALWLGGRPVGREIWAVVCDG